MGQKSLYSGQSNVEREAPKTWSSRCRDVGKLRWDLSLFAEKQTFLVFGGWVLDFRKFPVLTPLSRSAIPVVVKGSCLYYVDCPTFYDYL